MDRIFKEIFNYLQEKEMYYEGLLCTNARLNLTSEQERSAEKCLNLVKDITEKIEKEVQRMEEKYTLDEVIANEKDEANKKYTQGMLCHANPNDNKLDGYINQGRYHEQIAKWLEDYKTVISAVGQQDERRMDDCPIIQRGEK